jgi:hypothetical protein
MPPPQAGLGQSAAARAGRGSAMWGQSWQRVETGAIREAPAGPRGGAPAGPRATAVPLHDQRISPLPCRATGGVRLSSGRLSPQEFSTPPPPVSPSLAPRPPAGTEPPGAPPRHLLRAPSHARMWTPARTPMELSKTSTVALLLLM